MFMRITFRAESFNLINQQPRREAGRRMENTELESIRRVIEKSLSISKDTTQLFKELGDLLESVYNQLTKDSETIQKLERTEEELRNDLKEARGQYRMVAAVLRQILNNETEINFRGAVECLMTLLENSDGLPPIDVLLLKVAARNATIGPDIYP